MRAKSYEILSRAINEGIAYGWTRAHKHTDKPSADAVKDELERAVMSAICEVFDFDDAGIAT